MKTQRILLIARPWLVVVLLVALLVWGGIASATAPRQNQRRCQVGKGTDEGTQSPPRLPRRRLAAVKDADAYPSTPTAVVAAFVEAGFNAASPEELCQSDDVVQRSQYHEEAFNPGWDCWPIILGYRITETNENGNAARVKVIYWKIGYVGQDELTLEKNTTRDEVAYELDNQQGYWRISSPYGPPCISVKTAIALLECFIEQDQPPPPLDPTRVENLKKDIRSLRKLQKSCTPNWRR